MYDYTNKRDKKYEIRYSRYIASFRNEGGEIKYRGEFRDWLESLELDPEDIRDIVLMAVEGKLELELSAKKFLHNRHKDES